MSRHMTGWWLQHWAGDVRETIEQAVRINATGILVKAMDGLVWMARTSTGGPGSEPELWDIREHGRTLGVEVGLWYNVLHGDAAYLERAGRVHAEVALAAEVRVVAWDVEPYAPDFWGPGHPAEDAWRYCEAFRGVAPNVVTILQSDGRPARMAEIRAEAWLPYCNVYAPQAYWTDMQRAPFAVVQDCWAAVWHNDALRRDDLEFAPTLPGWDATPTDLHYVASNLGMTYNATAAILWRAPLGNDGRQAERERVVRDLPLWTPPPPGPCASIERDLLALKAGLRTELARPRLSRRRLEALVS